MPYSLEIPSDLNQEERHALEVFKKVSEHPEDSAIVQEAYRILDEHSSEMEESNYLMFFQNKLGGVTVDLHLEWWDLLQNARSCILAPRNSGKSYFFVIGYILWNMYYKRHKLIYLISDSQDQAVELLTRIKDKIENTPELAWLKPDSPETWTKQEIQTSNGVRLKAKGFLSAIRGPHPGLIILDDVLNDSDPMTQAGRSKAEKFFKSAISNMLAKNKKSQLIMVGTAQHYKDLLHVLKDNEAYVWRKYKAITSVKNREVLIPERWSWEELMAKKKEIGSLAFAKEFMNEPLDEESTIFPMELMKRSFDLDFKAPYVYNGNGDFTTFMGVDFSVPGADGGDWTVVVTIGVDKVGNYYLFDVWRGRGFSFTEQLQVVMERCNRYSVAKCFLEDNMFQGIYKTVATSISSLPIYGHTVTHSGKKSLLNGVPSMIVLFENMKMVLPYSKEDERGIKMTEMLCEELHSFRMQDGKLGTVSDHDDIVMAFWHAFCASKDISVGGMATKGHAPILKSGSHITANQQTALSDLESRGYKPGSNQAGAQLR